MWWSWIISNIEQFRYRRLSVKCVCVSLSVDGTHVYKAKRACIKSMCVFRSLCIYIAWIRIRVASIREMDWFEKMPKNARLNLSLSLHLSLSLLSPSHFLFSSSSSLYFKPSSSKPFKYWINTHCLAYSKTSSDSPVGDLNKRYATVEHDSIFIVCTEPIPPIWQFYMRPPNIMSGYWLKSSSWDGKHLTRHYMNQDGVSPLWLGYIYVYTGAVYGRYVKVRKHKHEKDEVVLKLVRDWTGDFI